MPCTRCNGVHVNDQFYAWVDEQGQLCMGAWPWASRFPMCNMIVYQHAESVAEDGTACIDCTKTLSLSVSST